MSLTIQSSSKPEKYQICPSFDGSPSWIIIKIIGMDFSFVSGPYLTKEEAESDLRVLKCEQE